MRTKVLFLMAMLVCATSVWGQSSCCEGAPYKKFGVELDGGLSIPISKLAGASLSPSVGGEILVHYKFMPHFGLYGGWGWNQLKAKESFAGQDIDFEETGYILGLEWKHPFVCSSPIAYYVRGGALYNHIEVENNPQGDIIGDTKHGWGYQVAVGVDIPMGSNFHFTPGVKFNSLTRPLNFGDNDLSLSQKYLSVRLGFLYCF